MEFCAAFLAARAFFLRSGLVACAVSLAAAAGVSALAAGAAACVSFAASGLCVSPCAASLDQTNALIIKAHAPHSATEYFFIIAIPLFPNILLFLA